MKFGRRAELGQRFLIELFSQPIMNVNQITKILDTTFPTAAKLAEEFEKVEKLLIGSGERFSFEFA